jgi:hypothetical protein
MIYSKSENYFTLNQPFPLNAELFHAFISLEQYTLNGKLIKSEGNEPMSDGMVLYNIVIAKMLENGVKFCSPGNSRKRNFICWFNSHFVIDEPYSHSIEIKEKYFDLAYDIVLNLCKESLHPNTNKIKISHFEQLEINNLTKKGKAFLTALLQ